MMQAIDRERADVQTDGDGKDAALGRSLDSTAALVRSESAHLDCTLKALVDRLSGVPGLKLSVLRRQGRLRRLLGDLPYLNDTSRSTAPIHKLGVAVRGCTYRLEAEPGSIRCWIDRAAVSGYRDLSAELPFVPWATKLLDQVARQNLVNYESLVALRHLVVHDQLD